MTMETTNGAAQVTTETIKTEREGEAQERRDQRRLNPVLLAWLQAQHTLYPNPKPLKGSDGNKLPMDLVNGAEHHPDVVWLKKAIPGLTHGVAVAMAWTLWRARQLVFWTRNLNKDTLGTETTNEGLSIPVLIHKGVDTMTWAQALEHADARDEIHDAAMLKRAENAKRRAALEQEQVAAALLVSGLGTVAITEGAPLKADAAAVSELITGSRPEAPDGDAKAQAQANRGFFRRAKGDKK